MTPTDLIERQLHQASSLEDAAHVLSVLLTDGYSVSEDGSLYEIKQLVARVGGIQIHVYSKEHAPPHFHVRSADIDAKFTVEDCKFLEGNIDGRERKLVEWWYSHSRSKIIGAWNATRPTNCQVGPVEDDTAA